MRATSGGYRIPIWRKCSAGTLVTLMLAVFRLPYLQQHDIQQYLGQPCIVHRATVKIIFW